MSLRWLIKVQQEMWAVASWVWCFTSTAARRSSLGAIQICDPGSYMDWKHQKTNGIQWVLELVNFAIQQNSSAADCNFPVQVDNLCMDSANVWLHLQEPVAFALRQFEIEMHGLFMLVGSIIYSHGLSMSIQILPFHDLVDTLWGVAQAQLVLGCVQDLRGAVKRAQRKGIDEVVWKDGAHGGSVKTEWLDGGIGRKVKRKWAVLICFVLEAFRKLCKFEKCPGYAGLIKGLNHLLEPSWVVRSSKL